MDHPHQAIGLLPASTAVAVKAEKLATELNIPLVTSKWTQLMLRLTEKRLELLYPADKDLQSAVWVDFTQGRTRYRRRQLNQEMVLKATKIKGVASPLVIDATAGLGRDGFLMAAAGWRVQMVERNPIIAALLKDGLLRAEKHPETESICRRITFIPGDALDYLSSLCEPPDAIYLDPMFPPRSKTAKVKKDLQLLQLLDHQTFDQNGLLWASLAAEPKKVVVKRPLKGAYLAGHKPSYSLGGKAVRFDIYIGNRR